MSANGVKVVGTSDTDLDHRFDEEDPAETALLEPGHDTSPQAPPPPTTSRRRVRGRRRWGVVLCAAVAVAGMAGTLGFGIAWAGLHAQGTGEAQVKTTASGFLLALTNFDAKTVDRDFANVTNDATGAFATQADKFFGSSIRQQLESAAASSRGQIRSLYVQSDTGSSASVYAVVDQLYANNKISAPQTDVLRVVVDLAQRPAGWKVSNVTVLEGPSLATGSSPATGTTSSTTPPG